MDPRYSVRDKIVAVTGGGSGIGLDYCLLARDKGARKVIIADLRLTETAQRAVQSDPNLVFQVCNVTKWKDLQDVIEVSLHRFGDVPDVYVASAGVFEPPYSNFWEDPEPLESDGYAHVDINVNHPVSIGHYLGLYIAVELSRRAPNPQIKLTRLALRALLGRNKKGVVALVSSIAGYSKHYSAPLYSATKHAVVGFARSMGDAEQVQGVKVVCVCPGIVKTPIWTDGAPGSGTRYGITDDIALTSSAVAATIDQAIESDCIPGGTILEISKLGGTRVVPEWNIDPPPGTEDDEAAVGNAAPPEMIKNVMGPILRVTEAERGTLVKERA